MKINRINYEQFAIDYLEGNLLGEDLREMEVFLSKNPDVKKELEEMELFYLEPEVGVVFEGKEALKKEVVLEKPKVIPFWNKFWMAGVAAILLLSFFTFILMNNINEKPENEIAVETPNLIEKEKEKVVVEDKKEAVIDKIKEEQKAFENVIEKQKPIQKKEAEKIIYAKTTPKEQENKRENETNIHDQNMNINHFPNTNNTIKPVVQTIAENDPSQKNETQPESINVPTKEKEPVLLAVLDKMESIASEPLEFKKEKILKHTVQIAEVSSVEKESKLEKWGFLPEGSRGRVKFSNIKKSLIPEEFASK